MPRFHVDCPLFVGQTLTLPDDVVRHVHVLRLQTGDPVTLFDGRGGEYRGVLVDIAKRSASARLDEHSDREAEPPYRVTLAQGIAGGDKMDWLIEKAVELGVAGIAPITAERGVVRLAGERAVRRQAHWQALTRAACEQCGRNRVPDVAPPRDLNAWLTDLPAAADGELRLLLSPRAEVSFASLPADPPCGPVTLLIGPEAGFSPAEEQAIIANGFAALGLGPRVLRTETAGVAVLAALAARWGGW
ncbi:16S ribosomal RNA methyltransferase RsmE [Caballeronia hypogeia]|uniref:Ribosomal RNA small subunit methyltransferase E n=1 Tax=Caballeronia hypogeia TaxID=1777140 RepID=A0A158CNG8_9BURK|nr:16S rRNA (uracil(1498)-N(3))-methyltransferase [Caballeronia hypogeia]SAK83914.1 16S ribosomal RNA methyltransferase RsmE [Caballeronia hypogeia]